MIWARVVDNEIIEIQDVDPSTLYHPDLLDEWKSVPDYCHAGWRYKNHKWISGSQWYDELLAENPIPQPGPPSAGFAKESAVITKDSITFKVRAVPSGIYDSFVWDVAGKTGTEEILEVTVPRKAESYIVTVKLTVKGPGGDTVGEFAGDEGLEVMALDSN